MRLIDANELIKSFKDFANDEGSKNLYGKKLDLILKDCIIEVEQQPTAYDVDKVVERLEKRKKYLLKEFVLAEKAEEVKEKSFVRINEIDGIIGIVKAGGANE